MDVDELDLLVVLDNEIDALSSASLAVPRDIIQRFVHWHMLRRMNQMDTVGRRGHRDPHPRRRRDRTARPARHPRPDHRRVPSEADCDVAQAGRS